MLAAVVIPAPARTDASQGNEGLLANWYKINNLDTPGLNNKIDGHDKHSPEVLFESSYFERIQTGVTDSNGLFITSPDLDTLAGQMGVPKINGDYKYFGIKFTGYLTPQYTGTYSFRALCDNAFFVTFDGKAVLDFWAADGRTCREIPITELLCILKQERSIGLRLITLK